MAKRILQPQPSSQTSRAKQAGLTLVEVLVAAAIGAMVLAVSYALTLSNKSLLDANQARTETNQNIRGILDLVTDDVRIAGERLAGSPPLLMPVEITPQGELILRKNNEDAVLSLCFGNIAAGSTNMIVSEKVNEEDRAVACAHTNVFPSHLAWQRYAAASGGTMPVYIYQPDMSDPYGLPGRGEFVTYQDSNLPDDPDNSDNDVPDNRDRTITISPTQNAYSTKKGGTNQHQVIGYDKALPSLYLLEERRYFLRGATLFLSVNGGNAQAVADNVTNFTARAILEPGTTEIVQNTFNVPDDWTNLKAIEISITRSSTNGRNTSERTVNARVYPRNHQSQ